MNNKNQITRFVWLSLAAVISCWSSMTVFGQNGDEERAALEAIGAEISDGAP